MKLSAFHTFSGLTENDSAKPSRHGGYFVTEGDLDRILTSSTSGTGPIRQIQVSPRTAMTIFSFGVDWK